MDSWTIQREPHVKAKTLHWNDKKITCLWTCSTYYVWSTWTKPSQHLKFELLMQDTLLSLWDCQHVRWGELPPFLQSTQQDLEPHPASSTPSRNATASDILQVKSLFVQTTQCLSSQLVKCLVLNCINKHKELDLKLYQSCELGLTCQRFKWAHLLWGIIYNLHTVAECKEYCKPQYEKHPWHQEH